MIKRLFLIGMMTLSFLAAANVTTTTEDDPLPCPECCDGPGGDQVKGCPSGGNNN